MHLGVPGSGLFSVYDFCSLSNLIVSSFIDIFIRQVALVGSQINWTSEVLIAFARLEEGYENSLKEYNKKQIAQLNALIALLLGLRRS